MTQLHCKRVCSIMKGHPGVVTCSVITFFTIIAIDSQVDLALWGEDFWVVGREAAFAWKGCFNGVKGIWKKTLHLRARICHLKLDKVEGGGR